MSDDFRIRWFGELTTMQANRVERKDVRECYAWSRGTGNSISVARVETAHLALYVVIERWLKLRD